MRIPPFRSLRFPVRPKPGAPDYWQQSARFWAESETWWDNRAYNFRLVLIALAAGFVIGIIVILILGL